MTYWGPSHLHMYMDEGGHTTSTNQCGMQASLDLEDMAGIVAKLKCWRLQETQPTNLKEWLLVSQPCRILYAQISPERL